METKESLSALGDKGLKFIGLIIIILVGMTIYKDGFFNSSTFIMLGIFLIWFSILLVASLFEIHSKF